MKNLIYIIFATSLLFAKISTPIENVGSVSISDISPNVAVVDEGTKIIVKGSGFSDATTVIITADSTHESLKINTLSLGSSIIAQETYIYEDRLYVGYANDVVDNSSQTAGVLVYDLSSNKETPTLIKDNKDLNLTYVNSISIYNNKLYIGDGTGLFRFNISTDGILTSDGFYETTKNQAVKDIEFTSSNIIISTVDFSDIEDDNKSSIIFLNNQLTQDSNFTTGYSSWAFEVDIDNNNLYIANGDNGVVKTDFSGDILSSYSSSSVHDILIKDDYIYVAKLDKGIDILNKSDLTQIGTSFTTNGKSIKMSLSDDKIVVANKEDGVLVLDISTPTQLKEFAKFNASGDTTSVDIYNGYSYSANGFNGVVISDITKPNSMEDMVYNTQKISGKTNSVLVDGYTTYFTYTNSSGVDSGTQGGVVVTDLSNLQKPDYKTSFKILDNVNSLELTKKSDINETIKENLSLQNITFDGNNNRSMTNANQMLVQNGLAYVVDDYGLIIYDLENNISLGSKRTINIIDYNNIIDEWISETSSAKSIQIVNNININGTTYSKVAVISTGWGSVALFDVSDSLYIKTIFNDTLAEVYSSAGNYYSINSIVKDGNLYITTYQNQILKLDLSTFNNADTDIDFNLPKQQITSLVFDDGYAYISAGYDGLLILDENNMIDENNNSIVIGSYDTNDFVWFTKREGNLLYVADSYNGIVVLDITDKTNPVYLDTIKISGDVNDFDFIDAAMVVSSKLGGVVTIDKYLETTTTLIDNNTLEITFPNYQLLGDYNLRVMNDDNNFARVLSSITLISENEKNTMPTLDLQLRTKDGLDGEVVVDGQNMVILNALLSYDNTITNIFKELTTSQYQLTSSDNSIAQVYGNKIVFYNNGEVTITISAKGLSDSINFKIKNIEPLETSTLSNIDKLKNSQAVIVVGHIDSDNLPSGLTVTNDVDKLRFSINKIGNNVYKTLIKFGLKSEDIFYFNPNGAQTILDINNDKVKDDVTYNNTNFSWSDVTTLVDSLENNSSRPLVFYMVDHGDVNLIKVSANKDVTSTQIKTLFDNFQTNTHRKIVAVFDACYSGSIFDDLNNDTYGDRVIISSADASNPTYMDPFGVSFSKYFLTNMKKGNDLNTSFTNSTKNFNKKLLKYGVGINPQYYSNSTNQQKISDYAMTGGFPDFNDYTAKDDNLIYTLTDIDGIKTLSLDVNITLNYPSITKVYALILPPTAPQDVGSAKVINSEKVELTYNSNSGLFSGSYDFSTNGTYAINYLVEDDEDNMILSDLAYISIDKPILNISIEDIPHYSYKLEAGKSISNNLNINQNNIIFSLETNTSNGELEFNNGVFKYTPNSDFVGIDKFTFKVSDSESSSSIKTVNFIVLQDSSNQEEINTISKTVTQGWNLVGLDSSEILTNNNIDAIFTYLDGTWSSSLNNEIKDIVLNQGYWVKVKDNKDISLELSKENSILDISTLKSGWNLVSSATITDMSIFKDIQTIWAWNNITQTWKFYSSDAVKTKLAIDAGYESLSFIDNYDGFWVYK
ncbi:MAG: C13 family peptidase [Campylobacterota bacterium]|nr:C13 family peptidase [Campylobacterota bacterium]